MQFLMSRKAGAMLHWASVVLLLGTAAASSEAMARGAAWLFALVAALWVVRTLSAGPMARPGSRLTGALALAHLVIHRGMLTLVAATALAGVAAPGALHERLVWVTLAAAVVHVAFNFWREATGGGVLRRMLP
ncbi:MAG: hypothetical protein R6V44_03790 [Paracoccaceae bacterium]